MTKQTMKINMTHIPYRGGAPMTTDLIAGQIPVGIDVITASLKMSAAEFAGFVAQQVNDWGPAIKAADLK